jgi:hypothetical protein
VRSNGTVVVWGQNCFTTNMPPDLERVVEVAAGNGHVIALKDDGSVIGWGDIFAGAITIPPGLTNVVAVRAGQASSIAVKSDGTLVKWGAFADVPEGLDGVVDVQIGANHALALRSNGVVVAWGDNIVGQGIVPAGLNGVTAFAVGGNFNLVVTARPLILSISRAVTANIGDTVMFSVNATGIPLSYQWRRNGVDLPDATNAVITLADVEATDAGDYTVLVSNPFGSAISRSRSLSFPPSVITSQPESLILYRGANASFTITASGVAPLEYLWQMDGLDLPGATEATLVLPNVHTTNAGGYQVIITDAAGSRATSDMATLMIIDPTLPRLAELDPVMDTTISSSGSNPQGAATVLAGTRNNGITDRGLLRFDFGSLPANSMIQSAALSLTVIQVPRSRTDSNFSLHRVFTPWELDATWDDASSGTPWSAPGGLSDTDYSASSSASAFVAGNGRYGFGPSVEMTADVRSWLADPDSNQGWLLKSEREDRFGTARHFGSSESAQPPQLQLQYSIPTPQAFLADVSTSAGNLTFRFGSADGWLYHVECRDDVADGIWTTVTNVPAGPDGTIEISVPITTSSRFYRVVTE